MSRHGPSYGSYIATDPQRNYKAHEVSLNVDVEENRHVSDAPSGGVDAVGRNVGPEQRASSIIGHVREITLQGQNLENWGISVVFPESSKESRWARPSYSQMAHCVNRRL